MSGYFEWQHLEGYKQSYYIHLTTQELMAVAAFGIPGNHLQAKWFIRAVLSPREALCLRSFCQKILIDSVRGAGEHQLLRVLLQTKVPLVPDLNRWV